MRKTNYKAMQVAAIRSKDGKQMVVSRPGDTAIKAMSMGSWKANASKGGTKRGS